MKKALALIGAVAIGYVTGAIGMLVWAGYQLHEDWDHDAVEWTDVKVYPYSDD